MKLCDDTVTVFNRRWDAEHGADVYIPTVIAGVSWYGSVVSALGDRGLNAANQFVVRIPVNADFGGKTYVSPADYNSEIMITGLFTLANGDIIVKAAVTDDTLTPARIHAQYSDCFTILGVTDNRRAPNAPHFKVVGA